MWLSAMLSEYQPVTVQYPVITLYCLFLKYSYHVLKPKSQAVLFWISVAIGRQKEDQAREEIEKAIRPITEPNAAPDREAAIFRQQPVIMVFSGSQSLLRPAGVSAFQQGAAAQLHARQDPENLG